MPSGDEGTSCLREQKAKKPKNSSILAGHEQRRDDIGTERVLPSEQNKEEE